MEKGFIGRKTIYLRGKTGNPAHLPLENIADEVTAFFHFSKEEEGTRYYPTFRCADEKLSFVNKQVLLVSNRPCILLAEDKIYRFADNLEGIKLTPFFSKWNIQIPKAAEPQYYRKFISQLIESYKVIPKGFHIYTYDKIPQPVLKLENGWNNQPQFSLYFDYGREKILASEAKNTIVKLEKQGEIYSYQKVVRQLEAEKNFRQQLEKLGLQTSAGAAYILPEENGSAAGFLTLAKWISETKETLEEQGFIISQEANTSQYHFGEITLNYTVEDKQDWFDVYATVSFGSYKIPFIKLRKYILNQVSEFVLPDGKVAIIPQEWFTKYKDLMALSNNGVDDEMRLKKHHFGLLENIFGESATPEKWKKALLEATVSTDEKEALPEKFRSVLRPYQEEGFHWMRNLQQNKFGGCLADDMGLGKTVQTLALLLSEQEKQLTDPEEFIVPANGQLLLFSDAAPKINHIRIRKKIPSLIVMPTSLIHNWLYEVKKWAPNLKTVNYTGLERTDKIRNFTQADLILTTYGTLRNDVEMLQTHEFNYIILDESQVIKNPLAKTSKAVKTLRSKYKLSLSGTPIENSLMDLWSQMTFLNPGLLGSYQYFRDQYAVPIEKKNDAERRKHLRKLISPFILRRTKEQVAKDLPSLTEKIYFSEMTANQKEKYEEARNYFRKKILESIDTIGEKKSQIFILRGLMQLRLIANHPYMNDTLYDGDSGKFDDITNTLESVLAEGHKVLVFSQFVRHLDMIAAHLKKQKTGYAYLTGQTKNRQAAVQEFKDDPTKQVFLISLKAGGVGLTLTEADYVFMCDPWWNPAAEQQAINRAHRIGQDKSVFAYKFISKNTVEEKILQLQERKLKLSSDLISDNGNANHFLTKRDIEILFS
ncbi:MAG: DEAD/DEAH box helicase [Sphingobacteriales bacterium]|nr:MAG: DEAD/DEAH box helicase [Sphingobacteriales bacterium]